VNDLTKKLEELRKKALATEEENLQVKETLRKKDNQIYTQEMKLRTYENANEDLVKEERQKQQEEEERVKLLINQLQNMNARLSKDFEEASQILNRDQAQLALLREEHTGLLKIFEASEQSQSDMGLMKQLHEENKQLKQSLHTLNHSSNPKVFQANLELMQQKQTALFNSLNLLTKASDLVLSNHCGGCEKQLNEEISKVSYPCQHVLCLECGILSGKEKRCKSCEESSDFVSQCLLLDKWRLKLLKLAAEAKEIGMGKEIEQKAYRTLADL